MKKGEIPRSRSVREIEAKRVGGKLELQGQARDSQKKPTDLSTRVFMTCGHCHARNHTRIKIRVSHGQRVVYDRSGNCGNCDHRVVFKGVIDT